MASLQGLPPLPRSLHGLLQAGSAHWKETERILQIRASIQQDIIETQSRQWGSGSNMSNGDSTGNSPAGSRRTTVASLQATLSQLRREMVSLRQLDMSLLCQLWSLNESIQEYKHLVGDRISETNSECSNYSLENGLDTIPSIEEEQDSELLNSSVDERYSAIFEDIGTGSIEQNPRKARSSLTQSMKSQRSRTPPKQRPRVPPPAAPRPPDSPTPPPRTRTPPTQRAAGAGPPLPQAPPPTNRAPPLPSGPPPSTSLNRTASMPRVSGGSPSSRAPNVPPPNPPVANRTPPPRNNTSTPPLPQAPPPVHRTPPTKRLPHVQSTPGPQAPPRRNRNTPPRNSQSSPSLSQRSSFSTCSNRSSNAYGEDC